MRNCPSKCALAMDACVQINIACTYISVQFCEHHLCKLHKHIFLIIFHCTLHYICSFVLCTLLIGGNKELLLLLFEHEADRPSVQHHPRDLASVNAMKQTCVIVILA